ncbi:MAG TPA: hypothetical protein VK472_01315, partial [Allosphingosinicella sp.]|nr:hypothetical protein [Allosphingosinicella sp.]
VDQVACEPPPLRLWQDAWTGKLFSIDSVRAAGLLSRGCVSEIANALPLLSNCLVPRTLLQSILDRFGDVCNSTSPDTAFMSRFFALRDRYLHYDRALGILYGSMRSSGLGYLRGAGGDFSDFMSLAGDRAYLDAAPVPGVNLGSNMLYHEYELVRRVSGDRLSPLDRPAILRELGSALQWIADPDLKASLGKLLAEQGWTGRVPPPAKRRLRSVLWEWVRRHAMRRLGADWGNSSGFSFGSDEDALGHALRHPRPSGESVGHLALLAPVEVPMIPV